MWLNQMIATNIFNCARILWNALLSVKRIKRCCVNHKYDRTNCFVMDDMDDIGDMDDIDDSQKEIALPRKIITWNIQGLFLYMGQDKTDNIIDHIREMDGDIVCLQEVFEDELRSDIINRLSDIYPYYLCGNLEKRYIIGEDSGLLVLSKRRIKYQKEVILSDYSFPDSMANKSILYFESYNLHFATTHLQSSCMSNSEHIATSQIQKILIESPQEPLIICGDLNHKRAHDIMGIKCNNEVPTCDSDILDYICNINYDQFQMVPYVPYFDLSRTSDHRPIIGYLSP